MLLLPLLLPDCGAGEAVSAVSDDGMRCMESEGAERERAPSSCRPSTAAVAAEEAAGSFGSQPLDSCKSRLECPRPVQADAPPAMLLSRSADWAKAAALEDVKFASSAAMRMPLMAMEEPSKCPALHRTRD
jgi:hypothetical protein